MLKYEKIKKILTILILSVLSLFLIFIFIVGIFWGLDAFKDHKKNISKKNLFESIADSVYLHKFSTYKANGVLKIKPIASEKIFSYIMSIYAEKGFRFSEGSGSLTIKLIDKDGFVVCESSLKDYVTIKDDNDYSVAREYTGEKYFDINNFINHKSVNISHSIEVIKIQNSKLSNKPSDSFSKELDYWTKKVNKIRIGMTFDEMIAVAGKPRITSKITGHLGYGHDPYKYNYGTKWIYFRDQLVHRIEDY